VLLVVGYGAYHVLSSSSINWYREGYNYATTNINLDPEPYSYDGTTPFDLCAAALFLASPSEAVKPTPKTDQHGNEWADGCESGVEPAGGGWTKWKVKSNEQQLDSHR
jgi:hypothetical protein